MMLKIVTFINLYLIILLAIIKPYDSYIDMFIDANETFHLMNISNSFFYVYNGELRQNSIRFQLDIPENKRKLSITWETANLVNYKFNLSGGNRNHKLSISSSGFVPNKQSKFYIEFDCSSFNKSTPDLINIIFQVYFALNTTLATDFQQLISMPPLNFTIYYNKRCTKQSYLKTKYPNLNRSLDVLTNYSVAYLIISVLGGFSILIITIGLFMFFHNKFKIKKIQSKYVALHSKMNEIQNKQQHQILSEQLKNKIQSKYNLQQNKKTDTSEIQRYIPSTTNNDQVNETNIYETVQEGSINIGTENFVKKKLNDSSLSKNTIREEKKLKNKLMLNLTTNTIKSNFNSTLTFTQTNTNRVNNKRNNIELCTKYEFNQIEIGKILIEGKYSKILNGKLNLNIEDDNFSESSKIKDNKKLVNVLIKVLKDNASFEQTEKMLKESCSFRDLKHKNLNSILGVCFKLYKKPITLFTYCELGNLKLYLISLKTKKKEITDPQENTLISIQELLFIILQMFKALNYLHSKQILHKDIATRNCWLNSNFSLKLADCALSQDLFPNDYHILNNKIKPLAWMALESLNENIINIYTEIWSCGVFLWECFSFASQPYEDINPSELAIFLENKESNRLEKPLFCPDELYELYKKCWLINPTSRPSLKEVFYKLHKFYSSLHTYV